MDDISLYHIVSIGSMHMVDCVELTIFYCHLWYSKCTEKSTYWAVSTML